MKRKITVVYALVLWLIPITVLHAEMREAPFLTVMAASSLTLPLTEIIRSYSAVSGVTVNVTYDSSSELGNQIDNGEHADVFISSSAVPIAMLKRKELVDVRTLTDIAHNKLALVASVENPLATETRDELPFRQLLSVVSNHAMLVVGNPDTTPLGIYTRELLWRIGLWDKVRPMMIRGDNSREALYLIAQGKSIGITYYSDAVNSKEVKIISIIPKKYYSPILYKAIALEGISKPFATQFIDYLSAPPAQKLLKNAGFEIKE